jgi:hypothetical protein
MFRQCDGSQPQAVRRTKKKKPFRNQLLRKGLLSRGNKTPVELFASAFTGGGLTDQLLRLFEDLPLPVTQPILP